MSRYDVVIGLRAQRQLRQLRRFLTERAGVERASAYVDRVLAACDRLSEFAGRGTPRDDLMPGLRTLALERRVLVAFTVVEGRVVIHGVFYGG